MRFYSFQVNINATPVFITITLLLIYRSKITRARITQIQLYSLDSFHLILIEVLTDRFLIKLIPSFLS